MSNYIKQLPTDDPELNLSAPSGSSLTTLYLPEVKEPMSGRRGRELANEVREKQFRLYHQLILERLALKSIIVLDNYAMEVVDAAIDKIVDQYYGKSGRHPVANAVMKQMTEVCLQHLVAAVKEILDDHMRNIGRFL